MNIGELGYAAVMAIAACGSGIGVGIAGMATVGAWKKCYMQNKAAPFLLIAFIGAPMTQTIYGLILMNALMNATVIGDIAKIGIGLFGGLAICLSAVFQGKIGASASDALSETGKGFGNYLIAIGLIETVALFVMVFMLGVIK